MTTRLTKQAGLNRTCKLAVVALFVSAAVVLPHLTRASASVVVDPQRRAQRQRRPRATAPKTPPLDYTKFSHASPAHKLDCSNCHKFPSKNWKDVRKKDPIPDVTEYPEHSSCINCHREQFFARERPAPAICSNCHVGVTPRYTARKPFPNPREIFDASPYGQSVTSEFGIHFAHDKHVDIVSLLLPSHGARRGVGFVNAALVDQEKKKEEKKEEKETSQPASCAVCHHIYMPQGDSDDEFVTKPPKGFPEDAFWIKKGTFRTSPDHTTCFTCHNADTGIEPTQQSCNACHKLLPPSQRIDIARAHNDYDPALAAKMGVKDKYTLERWSQRNAARFRHEYLPHVGLACTDCHDTTKFDTLDRATMRVNVKSCGGAGSGCHIEQTNEGILNELVAKKKADPTFNCTKCHAINGAKPLPESHVKALPPPPAPKKG